MAAAVLCSFPLQLAPAMPTLERACCGDKATHTYSLRTAIVAGCACVILAMPDVQMLVALTGALTTTTIGAFPFAMQVQTPRLFMAQGHCAAPAAGHVPRGASLPRAKPRQPKPSLQPHHPHTAQACLGGDDSPAAAGRVASGGLGHPVQRHGHVPRHRHGRAQHRRQAERLKGNGRQLHAGLADGARALGAGLETELSRNVF